MGCAGPTNPVHAGLTSQLEGLEGSAVNVLYQKPKDIFRSRVESIPRHFRAVLAASTQY